jgi:Type I phosphodiesterase / nucleotide pyrophosphatase
MPETSITIAVFIDALGWRLAREYGFLSEELPYRGPLATTFGAGATCNSTILTGVKPREHGHFATFTYDPSNSPFRNVWWARLLPEFLTRRGRIRRWFGYKLRRYVGTQRQFDVRNTPFHLLPQLDYTEKRDLYEPTSERDNGNGASSTLFDDLLSNNVPFHLSDWRLDEEQNLAAAREDIASGKPRLAYIFLPQLDALQQREGTSSQRVVVQLRWYEQQVRELIAVARQHYSNVTVSAFSDHGITDIRKECALMQIVNSLPLEFGKDYFAVYDATMARFWFLNSEAERLIGDGLRCHPDGQWLSDETLSRWGCDFPDRRYGDRFFLLKPGILLSPSFMSRNRVAGTHGFDPSHEDSVAFFATNEPQLPRPQGLEDLRRVLTHSLGLAS